MIKRKVFRARRLKSQGEVTAAVARLGAEFDAWKIRKGIGDKRRRRQIIEYNERTDRYTVTVVVWYHD